LKGQGVGQIKKHPLSAIGHWKRPGIAARASGVPLFRDQTTICPQINP
jgi:hypothetical protein